MTNRVFVASGVMRRRDILEIMCGIYSADDKEQAASAHVRWMMECKPGWSLHNDPTIFEVPNEFILEAAAKIQKGLN